MNKNSIAIRSLREKPAEVNTYVPFKIHIIPENEK